MISSEHGKTFDDARARSSAAWRSSSSRAGSRELTKGEFSDQVSTGVDLHSFRQPLGVCAGITPFNFPIMVPSGCTRSRSRPATRSCSSPPSATRACPTTSPALRRGRAARRRLQRRPRRQGRGRRAARPSGRRGGLVRRLDADRQVHPRARDGGRQARAGARRREEPRDRDARRRPGLRLRPADRRGLRSRRPALHGDLASPSRSATPATSSSRGCARRRSA